ncbi:MAG: OsmC family protein [Actinomycetota bacterium]
MAAIEVRHRDGDRFTVSIRGHELTVDQPVAHGGTDAGPTPTELFVAGLASCVGFYAGRFLQRHGIEAEGLAVECSWTMAEDRPARVGAIDVVVRLPDGFPEEQRDRLMAVVEHCTVHNSLVRVPEVRIAARVVAPTSAAPDQGERRSIRQSTPSRT